jgi:hypothetical protein
MLRSRNVVMMAASAGAVVVLAGCGSSSSSTGSQPPGGASSSLAAVQSAYSSTIGKKSAKFALTERVNTGGHALTITGTGLDAFAAKQLDLTTTIAGQQIEVREINQVLYERLPGQLSSGLPGHTPWLSINLNSLLKHATGASLSQLESGQQDDPASILSYLKQASANGLRKVGTASIRGVSTTQYTANIDLDKVAAARGGAFAKVIKTEEKVLGSSTYPISLWVDGQGLVRQLSYHLTVSPGAIAGSTGTPGHASVSATIQLYDFGTPVSITAPPASQTTDLTKVLQGVAKQPLGSSGPAST